MKLELKRIAYQPTYTIGKLYVNGVYFCDTLEDVPRDVKIMNETCIPAGIYKIILNMSNRFQKIMPLLLNVPGFEGIRIHSGNTAANTSGCVLVGRNIIKGQLTESRVTMDRLMDLFKQAVAAKETITIEIS